MVNSDIVVIHDIGPVLFKHSKRAKRIRISLKPFEGVRVVVPDRWPFKKAEEFVHTKIEWIQKHLHKIRQYEKENKLMSAALANIDREKAKLKLTGRLKYLAEKHGLTYNRVFIRNQKTRWGSCSHRNNISLNMKIFLLPEELMDYVILHELTHTRVKNHSNKFWDELNILVDDGKGMSSKLREYGAGRF
ncbi:M48 family metallopeptidase [Chloroflexota bacterium]